MGGKVAEDGNTDGFDHHQVGFVFKFDGRARASAEATMTRVFFKSLSALI